MKSPEYALFRFSLFLTLSLGSLLIERDPGAAAFLIYPLIYALAFIAQDWLAAELPFHPAETHSAAKDENEESVLAGSKLVSAPGPSDESRYLSQVAAVQFKRGAAFIGVVAAFLLLEEMFSGGAPMPRSALWHLLAALLLVPAASLSHFMLPLGLQALLVTSYLSRADSPAASWIVYFSLFLLTLLLFQIVRRHLQFGSPDQEPPRLDGTCLESLLKNAGLLALILLLSDGLIMGHIQGGLSRLSEWARNGLKKAAPHAAPRSRTAAASANDAAIRDIFEGSAIGGAADGRSSNENSSARNGSSGGDNQSGGGGSGGANSGGGNASVKVQEGGGSNGGSSGGDNQNGGGNSGGAKSGGGNASAKVQDGAPGATGQNSGSKGQAPQADQSRGDSNAGGSRGSGTEARAAAKQSPSQPQVKKEEPKPPRDYRGAAKEFLKFLGIALAAAALIAGAYLWLKRRKRETAHTGPAADILSLLDSLSMNDLSPREQIIAKYKIFLKGMARALEPKEDFIPPTDYCWRLRSKHPGLGRDFTSINDLFCRTLYADRGVTAEDLSAYDQALGRVFRSYDDLKSWVDLAR